MLPIIESLLVLQDRDRRLIRLRAELETVAPQRALLRGKSSQAQVALDEAKRRLTTAEGERKRLEQEAASLRQRIQKFQAEQQSTRSNDQYKLFQQQIEAAEANIRKLEDGEIELMDGEVRGLAVHIGARVAALAAPGEVLVSSTVRDLVSGSGLTFSDRGEHDLKGVPARWRVYAAVE